MFRKIVRNYPAKSKETAQKCKFEDTMNAIHKPLGIK